MKHKFAFNFWYFGELFLFLHWAGVIHVSWWWLVLCYAVDLQEGFGFYKRGVDVK